MLNFPFVCSLISTHLTKTGSSDQVIERSTGSSQGGEGPFISFELQLFRDFPGTQRGNLLIQMQ